MKQTKLILLMMAACLAGCSSDDAEPKQAAETKQTVETPRPMIVDVQEKPILDAKTSAPMLLKRSAEYITTASLNSFSMDYLSTFHYAFTKQSGGAWNTDQNWPSVVESSQKIDFYAYTGGTFYYNEGNPYVTFTVEEAVQNQYDLLVAENKGVSYNDATGKVSLSFDHACAILHFNVYLSSKLRANLGSDLSVTSIILRNVNSQGRYNYSSKSWSDQSGSRYYTLADNITVTTTPTSCGYVFMIPQKRNKNGIEGTHLEINYVRNEQNKTATIPLEIDWQAGKLYTININIGTAVIKS